MKKRILQLIDSLDAGGAERIAVNLAHVLNEYVAFSALVVTRKEGVLKEQLDEKLPYLFLNRKSTFDYKALWLLRQFVINNKINIIHAHSSSYFFAVLLKLLKPSLKIVWHDHNGNREKANKDNMVLILCSIFFYKVFVVSKNLEIWSTKWLFCKYIYYVSNFSYYNNINNFEKITTKLKGLKGKRIVCLANLRMPKNHLFLLKCFYKSNAIEKGWSLHFIGEDKNDVYSKSVKDFIYETKLEDSVFIYGVKNDVNVILEQSEIGILGSTYEAFPMTILEYGLSSLAVISTNVGQIESVIHHQKTGLLVDRNDENSFICYLNELIENPEKRIQYGKALKEKVLKEFSPNAFVNQYLKYLDE